jgi:hypothetical protein
MPCSRSGTPRRYLKCLCITGRDTAERPMTCMHRNKFSWHADRPTPCPRGSGLAAANVVGMARFGFLFRLRHSTLSRHAGAHTARVFM